jgi:hypothetical protein
MLRRRTMSVCVPLLSSCIMAVSCSSPEGGVSSPPRTAPPLQSSRPQPPPQNQSFIVSPDLPPLPASAVIGSGYPPEVVRAVHVFAARHPEVLRYMPCFCGCERGGHKGNDDCFVAGRDSTGKVTAWDVHGVG